MGETVAFFSKKERDQLQKHEELRCAKVAGIMIMIRFEYDAKKEAMKVNQLMKKSLRET